MVGTRSNFQASRGGGNGMMSEIAAAVAFTLLMGALFATFFVILP